MAIVVKDGKIVEKINKKEVLTYKELGGVIVANKSNTINVEGNGAAGKNSAIVGGDVKDTITVKAGAKGYSVSSGKGNDKITISGQVESM